MFFVAQCDILCLRCLLVCLRICVIKLIYSGCSWSVVLVSGEYVTFRYGLTDAVMTNLMLSLLLLYCHGNWHSSPGHLIGATAGHGESVAPPSAKRSRSSCRPLGGFVSCYDVVHVPALPEASPDDTTYRRVDLPVVISALGRNFSLRLRSDPVTGVAGGVKPEMAWSSVLSPLSVVSVMGEGGNVSKYSQDDLGISWYVGLDAFEVAPSSVLASVVDFHGQQLFRAAIHTTADVYYIEPALQYRQVEQPENKSRGDLVTQKNLG